MCGPTEIADLPLLHVEWVDTEWTGWDEFLRRAGIVHGTLSGRRFSTFGVALQAFQEDQGLAVGWHRLVEDLVDAGKIVPFTDLKGRRSGIVPPARGARDRTLFEARAAILKTWLNPGYRRAGGRRLIFLATRSDFFGPRISPRRW